MGALQLRYHHAKILPPHALDICESSNLLELNQLDVLVHLHILQNPRPAKKVEESAV